MDGTSSLASDYRTPASDAPLTERLIAHLPGPHWLWIAAWALLPLLHHVVLTQLVGISSDTGYAGFSWRLVTRYLPSHAVQSYMIILAFWASRKLAADVRALEPTIARLCPARETDSSPFAALSSLAGPIALSAVVVAAESTKTAIMYGVTPAILFLPYQALWVLPLMTLPWVYVAFLLGLDRLGRERMNLGSFPEDLSLGLRPVGTTVFGAFLIFCVLVVPFLLVSLRDWLELAMGLALFAAGVGAFFLSVWRLHRQMAATRQMHVARAGALYAETYAPIRAEMTPATLQACAGPLNAAEALVRRAHAIQEWPFDERTLTRIVGISTGVATAIIARFVLSAIGL